ncbi:hypothetical protein [Pseudomonas gingeri]
MTIITQHQNPAEYAPSIFFNNSGHMPWSGRHASTFSGLELVELFEFCEKEGHRQGINDANQNRIGEREEAPFHQEFMGGYPKQLWEQAYWIGVDAQLDSTPSAIEAEIQAILNDSAASHWLRNALTTSLARDSVDALNDADSLHEVLRRRFNAMVMQQG